MTFDQYTIFFFIALFSTGLSLAIAFAIRDLRLKQGAGYFTTMLVLIAIWTGAVAIGMLAATEEIAYTWIIIRMIGVIFCPVAWILMVLQFTGRQEQINLSTLTVLLITPLVSLLILLTNSNHHLFITDIQYTRVGLFLIDETWQIGPYFLVHASYSYILTLVGVFYILRESIRMGKNFRRQSIIFILATIVPIAFNISYSFHLIPALKVNYDPLGFVLSGLILSWGIYNQQLFDLSPIARELLVDNMTDGMIVINENNQIVDINTAALEIFDLTEQAFGKNLATVFARSKLPHLNAFGRSDKQQIEFNSSTGQPEIFEVRYADIMNKQKVRGKLITIRDITEQKSLEARLQLIAITDSLTGLANHRHFYELLDLELDRAMRNKRPFSLVMFDIDLFKQVNDTYGHLVGDQVLREIAKIGKSQLRPYDILCRYGGEEFTLILPETWEKPANVIAERLRQKVADHSFQIDDIRLNLTISLGVSHFNPEHPTSPETLVDQADRSLYKSKQGGRNRVTCWD